jgi:hypothetical protein
MPRHTPLIPIDLDHRRHIRLDMQAIFQAELAMCALWNKQVNILALFSEPLTLNDLAILLHQGLLHEDPNLLITEVQDLMTFDRLSVIMTAIFEAWNAATQPATTDEGGDTQADPLSFPGVPSGATPVLS